MRLFLFYCSIPYSLLCPVYFFRYPSPVATHVHSVDVLFRQIIKRPIGRGATSSALEEDEERGQYQHVLKTTRLIFKTGTLPKWAPKSIIKNAESWVLEESEVDLDALEENVVEKRGGVGREMRSWTRNLDHANTMAVTESNVFRESFHGGEQRPVSLNSVYDVTSEVNLRFLRNRIEKFGLNRVVTHIDSVSA